MSGSAREDTKDVVVVASGEAYSIAERWLNEMGGGDDGDEGEADAVDLTSRPPRLGLGAQFLPHRQVMGLMLPVEKRLSAKLRKRGKGNDSDDSEEEDKARTVGGTKQQPGGFGKHRATEATKGGAASKEGSQRRQQHMPAHKGRGASAPASHASVSQGRGVAGAGDVSDSEEDMDDSRVAALGKMRKKQPNLSADELHAGTLSRKRRRRK
eukprot:jgi/Mesvir1/26890/Mv20622-RA.1